MPKLIAHRGESYDAPENTLAAVNLAWQRGAVAVEVDIHQTADQKICVVHDFDTTRTTGQNLTVSKSTLAELRQLDVGLWKGLQWEGEHIPSLAQVLNGVPDHGTLVVEIKPSLVDVDVLADEIAKSSLRNDQLEVIAFDLKTLSRIKNRMPDIKMLWLLEIGPWWWQYLRGRNPRAVMAKLRKHGLDGINIGDSRFLTEAYIKEFTQAAFSVYVWTVNDPSRAEWLFGYGIEAVTTDRAGWMKQNIK